MCGTSTFRGIPSLAHEHDIAAGFSSWCKDPVQHQPCPSLDSTVMLFRVLKHEAFLCGPVEEDARDSASHYRQCRHFALLSLHVRFFLSIPEIITTIAV